MNGSHDRETTGLPASGFVTAITDSLNRTYGYPDKSLKNLVSSVTVPLNRFSAIDWRNYASYHLLALEDGNIPQISVPWSTS